MTGFAPGDRAVLMRWGRPVCAVTIGDHPHPGMVWATDREGRSAPFRADGGTSASWDHARTRLSRP